MACSSCAQRRAAAGQRRQTMMRVEIVRYEVVAPDGRRSQFDDAESARAARGQGQVRRRVSYQDVPAAYAVRLDGVEIERFDRAVEAAELSKRHDGATVHMVATDRGP